MARSKDDIKHATAQAQLSEDEALRVAYKADTPLEAGKIADSEPVDLLSAARNISRQQGSVIADPPGPVNLFSAAANICNQRPTHHGNHSSAEDSRSESHPEHSTTGGEAHTSTT